ncbi:MAG: glycosyltransferase family 4 protein [Anaerolineae bacterium]|nr:glycosyltransferase family 4 protein [Anaerolineae bacterium]
MGLNIGFDGGPTAQGAGVGRYSSCLLRALLSHRCDDAFTIVLPRGMALPSAVDEARCRWHAVRLPVGARAAELLWHRLRLPVPVDVIAGRLEVFHSPNFLLPPLRRARGVVTVHDLSFLRVPQFAYPGLVRYLAKAVPLSVNRADVVLADSQCTADDVVELLGVPQDRVRVIYPGVGPEYGPQPERGEREALRAAYALDRPFVLCVGTIEPRKNYPNAIEGFGRFVQRTGFAGYLAIAGATGWMADDSLEAARRAGPAVKVLGRVPEEHLPALYRQATALLYPSHYEGFGLPPLEAMACGTLVVVAANSSLPEAAGDAAVYCSTDAESIAGALAEALSDDSRAEERRRRGLKRARRFTWERAAEAVRDIYHELA